MKQEKGSLCVFRLIRPFSGATWNWEIENFGVSFTKEVGKGATLSPVQTHQEVPLISITVVKFHEKHFLDNGLAVWNISSFSLTVFFFLFREMLPRNPLSKIWNMSNFHKQCSILRNVKNQNFFSIHLDTLCD